MSAPTGVRSTDGAAPPPRFIRYGIVGGKLLRLDSAHTLREQTAQRLLEVLSRESFLMTIYKRRIEAVKGEGTARQEGYKLVYTRETAEEILKKIIKADKTIGLTPSEIDFIKERLISVLHPVLDGMFFAHPIEGPDIPERVKDELEAVEPGHEIHVLLDHKPRHWDLSINETLERLLYPHHNA